MRREKKRVWSIIFVSFVGVAIIYFTSIVLLNNWANADLKTYIESFEPVQYGEDRIVPVIENGHYTVTVDDEYKVMHFTDIHIGGGIYSHRRDKKAVYEIITMLQAEKPDLVILGGDNTYCLFKIGFNGGDCFNNEMVARNLIDIFEHEGVYFSTVFGNHDTESVDRVDRTALGKIYMEEQYEYCIFNSEFTDEKAKSVPSVSNQFIVVKNKGGEIIKLLLLVDSNAYLSTSFADTVFGNYDVIHDAQIEWAKNEIETLSEKNGLEKGEYIKTLAFMHIPVGEYRTALDDLIEEVKDEKGNVVEYVQKTPSADTEFIEGSWGEKKVCYGGLNDDSKSPEDQDRFFEVLCEDMGSVEAIFCGHDHTNNAVVKYKGVLLDYGYSIDNIAYGNGISNSGLQRGTTVITLYSDGTFNQVHKNAYLDYGCETDRFVDVYLDHVLYPDMYRTYNK